MSGLTPLQLRLERLNDRARLRLKNLERFRDRRPVRERYVEGELGVHLHVLFREGVDAEPAPAARRSFCLGTVPSRCKRARPCALWNTLKKVGGTGSPLAEKVTATELTMASRLRCLSGFESSRSRTSQSPPLCGWSCLIAAT